VRKLVTAGDLCKRGASLMNAKNLW